MMYKEHIQFESEIRIMTFFLHAPIDFRYHFELHFVPTMNAHWRPAGQTRYAQQTIWRYVSENRYHARSKIEFRGIGKTSWGNSEKVRSQQIQILYCDILQPIKRFESVQYSAFTIVSDTVGAFYVKELRSKALATKTPR